MPPRKRRQAGPVRVISAHPAAWAEARRIVGRETWRLRPQPDGSVFIANSQHPRGGGRR